MDFPIQINTIGEGLSIIYFMGSHVEISKLEVLQSFKIVLVVANSADPDEMPHYAAFHLGLHCLPKYPFRGFQKGKGS